MIKKTSTFVFYIAAAITTGLVGCATQQPQDPAFQKAKTLPSYSQATFTQYLDETKTWLEQNRLFLTQDKQTELHDVAPREYQPVEPNGQGVLLVHGLGDTPYSFVDIATHLASKGYLVRTVLLPGHASKVGDLQLATLESWQGVVKHNVELLKRDTDAIWVGGYSTGANLATEQALQDSDIEGILLFSPAFRPNSSAVQYAEFASNFITWADVDPETNPLRYNSLPMNAAAVYYDTSAQVREKLENAVYDKPVFMLMSEADQVIDTEYAVSLFSKRFSHPSSHIIWQGENGLPVTRSTRFSMYIPEQRISNGSHMGLMFSPNNPYYGMNGSIKICSNGQTEEQELACMNGDPVWYSAWGHHEETKGHARLTYNPYFDESMALLDKVMTH